MKARDPMIAAFPPAVPRIARRPRTSGALSALVLLTLALAGCKGGDGPADIPDMTFAPSTTTPAPPPADSSVLTRFFLRNFDHLEAAASRLRNADRRYTIQNSSWSFTGSRKTYNSYPLAAARVEYAHAAGLTGAGQIVSVVDDGFLPGHEVFEGTVFHFPDSALAVKDHGTSVASVIAGNGTEMIGVAPGAALALGDFSRAGRTAATIAARELGAVAQNNSWGFPNLAATTGNFSTIFGGSGASYLAALDAYAAEGVVVFAVSNDDKATRATLMEALPALRPSLEAGWLAVVNGAATFNQSAVLSVARISAPCLEAARWCLVADGTWTAASGAATDAYDFVTGSSFAAPQVSAALALLGEAFPMLAPHDLRVRLLASADNSFFRPDAQVELAPGFFHGYGTEFGHGFLDLRAALMPIGGTAMQLASGTTITTDSPVVFTGTASGDAVAAALAAHRVLVADALGGDFLLPGDALVASGAGPALLEGRLDARLQDDLARLRLADAPAADSLLGDFDGTFLSFARPGSGVTMALALPREDGGGALGAGLSHSFAEGRTRFDLGVSILQEDGTLFGLSGPDGAGDTDAIALEFGAATTLAPGLTLTAAGRIGRASGAGPALFDDVTPVGFNSLSLDLARQGAFARGDRLVIGASLPTAIVSGAAAMTLPGARSAEGTRFDSLSVGLAPEHRQIDIGAAYHMPLGDGWEAVFEAARSFNDGHRGDARDIAALIGVQRRF